MASLIPTHWAPRVHYAHNVCIKYRLLNGCGSVTTHAGLLNTQPHPSFNNNQNAMPCWCHQMTSPWQHQPNWTHEMRWMWNRYETKWQPTNLNKQEQNNINKHQMKTHGKKDQVRTKTFNTYNYIQFIFIQLKSMNLLQWVCNNTTSQLRQS